MSHSLLNRQSEIGGKLEAFEKKAQQGQVKPAKVEETLRMVEGYWTEFNRNHEKLVSIGKMDIDYFRRNIHDEIEAVVLRIRKILQPDFDKTIVSAEEIEENKAEIKEERRVKQFLEGINKFVEFIDVKNQDIETATLSQLKVVEEQLNTILIK